MIRLRRDCREVHGEENGTRFHWSVTRVYVWPNGSERLLAYVARGQTRTRLHAECCIATWLEIAGRCDIWRESPRTDEIAKGYVWQYRRPNSGAGTNAIPVFLN